ncbi:MAG TPA: SusC/RagA family TonB-linked outer membrane protein [Longimicrobiaceae bacterium]
MRSPVLPTVRLVAGSLCALALLSAGAPAGLGPAPLYAQSTGVITGRVTGDGGRPVAGAVVEAGGQRAVTDADGRYTLTGVRSGTVQLRITAAGFGAASRAVTLSAAQPAVNSDFQLSTQVVGLEELVVVGYTAQRSQTVSDAVASVSADVLETRKVPTVEQALKGRIAGVNIIASGEPGRPADVVIRGQNFTTNPSPLYVVDGMYLRQNPGLNPDDIESVQVLKDASAASQYGAQSANGVIVITTKRGRAGEPRISLRSYYGVQQVARTLDLAGAEEWADLTRQIYAGAGEAPPAGAVRLNGVNTDWQDELFRRGTMQNHNLSVSGGGESASYLLSGGFTQEDGTVVGTGFERYSLRINSEARRGALRFGESLALSRSERRNIIGAPLIDAVRLPPVIPVRDENNASGFGYGSNDVPTYGTNPLGLLQGQSSTDDINQVIGTVYAQAGLPANLSYRFNLGGNYQDLNWRNFIRSGQFRYNDPALPARLTDRRDNSYSLLFENLLTYDNLFGSHQVTAVAGYTEQLERFNRLEAFRRGFADEDLQQIDAGTSELNNAGYVEDARLRSFLTRVNYSFADRYLLTGTFRRDGSSRFGPDNRWGNFGSVSAGWVVSEEGFYGASPLAGLLPSLKLRASYGVLGNQDIGNYQYAGRVELNRSYPFGGQVGTGAIQLGLANPDIKWQEDRQANFGADFSIRDALTVSADYYVRESRDLLVPASLPLSVVGYLNAPYERRYDLAPIVNAGSVRTTGFELGVGHSFARGDFRLSTSANLSTLSSEVTELGNGEQSLVEYEEGIARTQVGAPISSFHVLQTRGLFQTAAEVQAHRNSAGKVIQPDAKPGDVRYADRNDDGVINDADRYLAGSAIPDFEGGLFFEGGFRRFDFALGMRGVYGNEIFNRVRYWTERLNDLSNYPSGLQPWTPENPNTSTPRAVFGPQGRENARLASDRWIEDGSFLRIQNLELGFALPERLTRGLGAGLRDSRIYVNVQNLYTFTGYSGWDPEVRSLGAIGGETPLVRGFDDGRIYPNPRTFTVGIDLGL